jgi:hypothetical protein
MQTVTIVRDIADPIVQQDEVSWALDFLAETIRKRSISAIVADKHDTNDSGLTIIAAGPFTESVSEVIRQAGLVMPEGKEAFVLAKETVGSGMRIIACGSDSRGLVYAVLELADRIRYSPDPLRELQDLKATAEKPANAIRSVSRLFVSEVEDKPWYYDKTFWDEYLTELAIQRFNRFSLTLGMGYDLGHESNVIDNYFAFTYAFLLDVPGYQVTVRNLPVEEREHNLSMLKYISEQAKRRGLHFQLGLWTHMYRMIDSPDLNYVVEGLSSDNHVPYVRDALRMLLQECPAIDGLTLRLHYESGIPEPAHEFWRGVMPGIAQAGRTVEIDAHAKGLDDELIGIVLETGMPVVVSPKYWGEQMAVPYHQLSIREKEMNVHPVDGSAMWAVTGSSRRFTRYGYADFLKEDREYGILFRVWPATQRVLLWGDPVYAAGYSRDGQFCGSQGMELWEPLSFIGKKGTGVPGGRELYVDPDLQTDGYEWRKYLYYYRVWGRLLYNPEADPESWKRYLQHEFGAAVDNCEEALAQASRILPFITLAHTPSPGHNSYWPEMYDNVPIVNGGKREGDLSYDYDTFGLTSSLDPEIFYTVDDFADDLVKGTPSYKFSPLASAARLEGWAEEADRQLQQAVSKTRDPQSPEFRRFAVDVEAMIGLGRFFARKFRAALAYALFERTGDAGRLEEALREYRSAKQAWEQLAEVTQVYRKDLPFGNTPYIKGHWEDRLGAIDTDIKAMESQITSSPGALPLNKDAAKISYPDIRIMIPPACEHVPPQSFERGKDTGITVTVKEADTAGLQVFLRYRHANQDEQYAALEMTRTGNQYSASIPGSYADSPYPLVYFFVLRDEDGTERMSPGFDINVSNQPFYVIRENNTVQ